MALASLFHDGAAPSEGRRGLTAGEMSIPGSARSFQVSRAEEKRCKMYAEDLPERDEGSRKPSPNAKKLLTPEARKDQKVIHCLL